MSGRPGIDDLAPISLGELMRRASLQTRVDRKYLLPPELAVVLVGRLPAGVHVLEIDRRRTFSYSSLYLDTPELVSYRMAAQRRRRRFKVRIREYVDTGSGWLGVKTRQGPHTVKDRLPLPPSGATVTTRLDTDHVAYMDGVLGGAGILGVGPAALRPALRTRYRRTTLHLPDSDSRVTLALDLSFASSRSGRTLSIPELVVVETKTAARPCSVDRILWSLGARPVRVSKYGTGLAALEPDLPQATWRRVIRQRITSGLSVTDRPTATPTALRSAS